MSLESVSIQASQSSSAARTFPLTDSHTAWRPFINGVDAETSEARVSAAKEYLTASLEEDADLLEVGKSFSLDYKKLLGDSELNEAWPNLKHDIEENAEFVLGKKIIVCNLEQFYSLVLKHKYEVHQTAS